MTGFLILRALYWVITLIWVILMLGVLWREKDRNLQLSAIIVLVPAVLRLLMIK